MLARLEQRLEVSELRGRYEAEKALLLDTRGNSRWTVEPFQGGAAAFQLSAMGHSRYHRRLPHSRNPRARATLPRLRRSPTCGSKFDPGVVCW